MKIRNGWDDDEIQFAGFGSASTITEYARPKCVKRPKFKVGFAIPKKPRASREKPTTRGVR